VINCIVVNDHSEDLTSQLVRSFIAERPATKITILDLPPGVTGKKAAITAAIALSQSEIIVCSDADCSFPPNWICEMTCAFVEEQVQLVVGPVLFRNTNGFLQAYQQIEQMGLTLSSAGSLAFHQPLLCNGANLAYRRSAFLATEGYKGLETNPSGDDVQLLYRISRRFPRSVRYQKSKQALVTTAAVAGAGDLLEQRRRWASKGLQVMPLSTAFSALVVYLMNALLLINLITGLGFYLLTGEACFLLFSFILAAIKCFIDFLLLFLAASFFGHKRLLLLFLPAQVFTVFYVTLTVLLGLKRQYRWKGRKINLNG
jgi:cellulose synthase/poly-beta-1,6-N-acetylglucosamine synthase-like glycosyltransferase